MQVSLNRKDLLAWGANFVVVVFYVDVIFVFVFSHIGNEFDNDVRVSQSFD